MKLVEAIDCRRNERCAHPKAADLEVLYCESCRTIADLPMQLEMSGVAGLLFEWAGWAFVECIFTFSALKKEHAAHDLFEAGKVVRVGEEFIEVDT